LQASLADAFIDAIRADRIVIVETHSEHLLLRLLRRIRQTNANAELAGETALFPHELSVVYFDPTGGTDTTRLVALGVTNTGEFIGRWPAGFFTERDEELFGE
jgi:predicted ATPase